jgi:hypothetical protein
MDSLFTSVCVGINCDLIGTWVAALLTFLVFSYLADGLFGRRWDLPFRIATCLLVGTAIGFISAVVLSNVLLPLVPRLWDSIINLPGSWLVLLLDIIPLILGVSLLIKLTPNFRGTTFSNVGLAYLFGIGAALAIGGALAGALVPQLTATMLSIVPQGSDLGWINSILIVVGTLGAFLAFRFVQPGSRPWQRAYDTVAKSWGTVGRGFIMVAFGAILASVISARVSALVGQLYFLLHDWLGII